MAPRPRGKLGTRVGCRTPYADSPSVQPDLAGRGGTAISRPRGAGNSDLRAGSDRKSNCHKLVRESWVDVGLDTKALLTPEALESALVALKGQKPLGWLAGRRSVWVLGEGSSPEGWQVTLARLIGTDGRSIRTVRLPLTVPAASVSELERVSG